jgi:cytochrome c553
MHLISLSRRYFLMVLCLLLACGPAERVDNAKAVKQEIEARKIRKISPAQINEVSLAWGRHNAALLNTGLEKLLFVKVRELPLQEAAAFCNPKSISIADSLAKLYEMEVKRLSLRGQPAENMSPKEKEMWDAYRYNLEQKLPIEENVQKMGDSLMLYTTGILISSATCLKCHGIPGKDIPVPDLKNLRARYPAIDSLTGYTQGQSPGIWNLVFAKKNIVLKAGEKKK